MSLLVQLPRRDRRLKRDGGPLGSRLCPRLCYRMIWPNDLVVCLFPISFGRRAGGRERGRSADEVRPAGHVN